MGRDGRRWDGWGWMKTFEITVYRYIIYRNVDIGMGVDGKDGSYGTDGDGTKKEETLGGFLFFMGRDGIIQRGE